MGEEGKIYAASARRTNNNLTLSGPKIQLLTSAQSLAFCLEAILSDFQCLFQALTINSDVENGKNDVT